MSIKEIDETLREEIEQYLMLDEELLYSLIPPYIPSYQNTLFAPSGQTEAGIREFQKLLPPISLKICQEWELCQKIDEPVFADNVNLVMAVADVISPLVIGFPPFLIASLLVKIGLMAFCKC